MATEKHLGVPIFMNGKKYLVPSLSIKQFEKHADLLKESALGKLEKEGLKALLDEYTPVILDAFQRNYPDTNTENLRDWLDLANIRQVILAIQGVAGDQAFIEPGVFSVGPEPVHT